MVEKETGEWGDAIAKRLMVKRGRHQGNPSTLCQFWVDDGDPISLGASIDAAIDEARRKP